MEKLNQDKQGFSLIEVMIAMVVVSFFAAGVFGCLVLANKIYYSGRDLDDAHLILQYEIENVRGLRWQQIEEFPESEKRVQSASLDPYGDTYTLSREVDDSIDGMKKITFTVSWAGRNGTQQTLSSGDVAYTKNGLSDSFYREY